MQSKNMRLIAAVLLAMGIGSVEYGSSSLQQQPSLLQEKSQKTLSSSPLKDKEESKKEKVDQEKSIEDKKEKQPEEKQDTKQQTKVKQLMQDLLKVQPKTNKSDLLKVPEENFLTSGETAYANAHNLASSEPQIVVVCNNEDYDEVFKFSDMLKEYREKEPHIIPIESLTSAEKSKWLGTWAKVPYVTVFYRYADGRILATRNNVPLHKDIQSYYRWKNRELEKAFQAGKVARRTCSRSWFRGG